MFSHFSFNLLLCLCAASQLFDKPERHCEGHSSSCAAAQAAPMVLNLEDLAQSTSEVLEMELDALTHDQLMQLKCVLDNC